MHQGDGTALLLADQPRAFTCSLHCDKNFPLKKQHSDLDVPLPRGMGDADYLQTLALTLQTVWQRAQPDLILYDAGVDVHVDDRLGHLNLTDHGMRQRDRLVIDWARNNNCPIATVIGGGYDRDIAKLAARHAIVLEELCRS